jgi:hypothetical protein
MSKSRRKTTFKPHIHFSDNCVKQENWISTPSTFRIIVHEYIMCWRDALLFLNHLWMMDTCDVVLHVLLPTGIRSTYVWNMWKLYVLWCGLSFFSSVYCIKIGNWPAQICCPVRRAGRALIFLCYSFLHRCPWSVQLVVAKENSWIHQKSLLQAQTFLPGTDFTLSRP